MAFIFGLLGFLCLVWGILVAVAVVPVVANFDQALCLSVAGVLMLISIASALGRGHGEI